MITFFLFIAVAVAIVLFATNREKIPFMSGNFITRKFHYNVLIAFIAVLFIMTVIIEIIYPSSEKAGLQHRHVANEDEVVHKYTEVENLILEGKRPDTPLLVTSRTHASGETLEIILADPEEKSPFIIVEKSKLNDDTIEEFIYKPFQIINDYDFTDKVELTLPIWSDRQITIPKMMRMEINLVRFINQSIFKQFTKEHDTIRQSGGFGAYGSFPIIHLVVPEHLEIIDPYDLVTYVEQ